MQEQLEGMLSIRELIGAHFFIPDYQRGYRWTQIEVKQLLNDVWDFFRGARHEDVIPVDFYCLQPIVVRKMTAEEVSAKKLPAADWWEVIDGQQRLTTIFLLLMYNLKPINAYCLSEEIDIPFEVFYETREKSSKILRNIVTLKPEEAEENIDFLHMYSAFQSIRLWFEKETERLNVQKKSPKTIRVDFPEFLVQDRYNPHIRVIWYQLPPHESPKEVFMRLNTGKIPLSNVELIRALFLQSSANDETNTQKIELAQKWDLIEKKLQDNRLWYFLRNADSEVNKRFDSRIEILFVLYNTLKVDSKIIDPNDLKNNYNTFVKFHSIFVGEKPLTIWKEIEQYFDVLEEWFEDYTLYHLIGLRLELAEEPLNVIITLMDLQKRESHSAFEAKVKEQIRKKIQGKNSSESLVVWLRDIQYTTSSKSVLRHTLLAFNIATLLEKKSLRNDVQEQNRMHELRYMRFPFFRYKVGKWDIEHIHSVHSEIPTRKLDVLGWLKTHQDEVGTLMSAALLQESKRIYRYLQNNEYTPEYQQQFESLHDLLIKEFSVDDDDEGDINSIGNLTLLRPEINRSYGNALFPLKRKRVIHEDKTGVFSPLCTTNVFLKYYSKNVQHVMKWTPTDRENYTAEICTIMKNFFQKSEA